jgi:segregation and condensation protein A
MMPQFQVDLDQYCGPLDLLLHIVRREELDIAAISLAKVIDQYFSFLEVLVELEIDDVADFLEIASLLIEMKAKQAVPAPEPNSTALVEQPVQELTDDLVERLFQYKRIRDVSSILDEQSRSWQLRYSRLSNDLPSRRTDSVSQSIQPIEVWDLVSAFGRILRARQPAPTQHVQYDDTPIHVHMQRIHDLVNQLGRVELTTLFEPQMHKSTLVALFLATLELTRHYGLSTEQTEPCRPLYLVAGQNFVRTLNVHEIDNLTFEKAANSNLPISLR